MAYNFNVIVHQVDNPVMGFRNFDPATVPTLHISYHLGEHYNSVRLKTDPGTGPALPIGADLKEIEIPAEELKEEEEKKEAITKGGGDISERDQVVQYALMKTGRSDKGVMEDVFDDIFGKGELVSFENID